MSSPWAAAMASLRWTEGLSPWATKISSFSWGYWTARRDSTTRVGHWPVRQGMITEIRGKLWGDAVTWALLKRVE